MGLRSRKIGWFPSRETTGEPTPPTEVFRMLNDSFLTTGADPQNPVVGDILYPDSILWQNDFVDDPVDLDSIVYQWTIGTNTYNGKSLPVSNADVGETISYTTIATLVSGQQITQTVNITTNAVASDGGAFHPNDYRDLIYVLDTTVTSDFIKRNYDISTDPNPVREYVFTSLKSSLMAGGLNTAGQTQVSNGVSYLSGEAAGNYLLTRRLHDNLNTEFTQGFVLRNRRLVDDIEIFCRYHTDTSNNSAYAIRITKSINAFSGEGGGAVGVTDGNFFSGELSTKIDSGVLIRANRARSSDNAFTNNYQSTPDLNGLTDLDERTLRLNTFGGGTNIFNPNDSMNWDLRLKDLVFYYVTKEGAVLTQPQKDNLWQYQNNLTDLLA